MYGIHCKFVYMHDEIYLRVPCQTPMLPLASKVQSIVYVCRQNWNLSALHTDLKSRQVTQANVLLACTCSGMENGYFDKSLLSVFFPWQYFFHVCLWACVIVVCDHFGYCCHNSLEEVNDITGHNMAPFLNLNVLRLKQ